MYFRLQNAGVICRPVIGAIRFAGGRRISRPRQAPPIILRYRSKQYEGDSKDYEFSQASMEEQWRAGYHDAARTLRHPEVLEHPASADGVFTFDLAHDGRE